MSTYKYIGYPIWEFSNLGFPVSGGKLFTYTAGTTTKQSAWADVNGVSVLPNPIILDSQGRPTSDGSTITPVFGLVGESYRLVLANATDTDPPTSPIWSADNQVLGDTTNLNPFTSIASNTLSLKNTQLTDDLGQTALTITEGAASSVNWITITPAAAGNPPEIQSAGGDTNQGITVLAKGTGGVVLGSPAGSLPMAWEAGSTVNLLSHSIPSITSPRTVTWPDNSFNLTSGAFHFTDATGTSLVSGTATLMKMDQVDFDVNGWHVVSGRYAPLVSGYYQINATVGINTTAANNTVQVYIYKNGVQYNIVSYYVPATTFVSLPISDVVNMNGAGDYITIMAQQQGGTTVSTIAGGSTFSGYHIPS